MENEKAISLLELTEKDLADWAKDEGIENIQTIHFKRASLNEELLNKYDMVVFVKDTGIKKVLIDKYTNKRGKIYGQYE